MRPMRRGEAALGLAAGGCNGCPDVPTASRRRLDGIRYLEYDCSECSVYGIHFCIQYRIKKHPVEFKNLLNGVHHIGIRGGT